MTGGAGLRSRRPPPRQSPFYLLLWCTFTPPRWSTFTPPLTEYGGLKMDQAKRLKELEKENGKLKRLVAELALDKQILKDIAEGNLLARSDVGARWSRPARSTW